MFHDRSENHFDVLLLMKQVLTQLFLTTSWNLRISRSTCSEIFYKEAVLENTAKSTRKHLCWSPFKIKLQALKKTFSAGEIFKNVFLQNLARYCFWFSWNTSILQSICRETVPLHACIFLSWKNNRLTEAATSGVL